jgi:antitoxin component YwqK of YwqJK toxin-antitoxin module
MAAARESPAVPTFRISTMRPNPLAFIVLVAALLAAAGLTGTAWARRHKAPPPVTYPHVEWRGTAYADGAKETEWQVLVKAPGAAIRHGVFRRYHPNGRLALLGRYRDNEPVGVWSWLDDRGGLLRQARQGTDYDEEIVGASLHSPLSVYRNTAGRVTAEGLIKQGGPHGRWIYYHDNGAPKAEGEYLTGAPQGVWTYYYPDGQIERQMRFELGVPHGDFRGAYPSGQERERGTYDQGVRTGIWRTYHPNGQLQEQGEYREDLREGEWRSWDEAGQLTGRTLYSRGVAAQALPLPQVKREPEPLIPDLEALPVPPHVYGPDGQPIRRFDEDAAQAPPRPQRPPRPAPLSRWEDAARRQQ